MKTIGVVTLVLVGLVAGGFWLSSRDVTAKQIGIVAAPAIMQGEWAVSNHSIAGEADTEFATGTVTITASSQAVIQDATGDSQKIEFQSSTVDAQGIAQIQVTHGDDEEGMGGGGPRKAIARVNAAGNLEILEALSADDSYPTDFSATSIANGIYWTLSSSGSGTDLPD